MSRMASLAAMVACCVLALLLLAANANAAARQKVTLTWTPAAPAFGDAVYFTATNVPDYTYVHVSCYQGDAFVMETYRGLAGASLYDLGQPVLMSNTYNDFWVSGGARCDLDVGGFPRGRWRSLLTDTLEVAP